MKSHLLLMCLTFSLAVPGLHAKAPAPVLGKPAEPPIVFYTLPLEQLQKNIKTMARTMGANGFVSRFEDKVREHIGEKMFKGLDMSRPLSGYAYFPEEVPMEVEDWKSSHGMLVIPVSQQDEFLDFLKRVDADQNLEIKPVKGDDSLFECLSRQEEKLPFKVYIRFKEKWAYVGINVKIEQMVPSKLVSPESYIEKGDTALLTVRSFLDRMEHLNRDTTKQFDKITEQLKNAGQDNPAMLALVEAYARFTKTMTERMYKETTETGYRIRFDEKASEMTFDTYLKPKKDSALAKEIAARKLATNQFARLIAPNAAASINLQIPMFSQEFRDLIGAFIVQGEKNLDKVPEANRPLAEATLKGLARTIKGESIDFVASIAPEKDGKFTFLSAITFDDAGKLEKPIQIAVAASDKKTQEAFKFNTAKAGTVNLHDLVPPENEAEPEWFKKVAGIMGTRKLTGALGPKGIYVTMTQNPKATVTAALEAKPGPARAFDIQLNPKQLESLVKAIDDNAGNMVAPIFGDEDRPISVLYVSVDGNETMTYRMGMNVKILFKPLFMFGGLAR